MLIFSPPNISAAISFDGPLSKGGIESALLRLLRVIEDKILASEREFLESLRILRE